MTVSLEKKGCCDSTDKNTPAVNTSRRGAVMSRRERRAAARARTRAQKIRPVLRPIGCEHLSVEEMTQAADILEAAGLITTWPTGEKDKEGNDIWASRPTPEGLVMVESLIDFDEYR